MLDFEEYREFRNGKRYNTSVERTMNENGFFGENVTGNSSKIVEEEVSEIQTFTQEAVNEQIKGFIAPLTRQLEKLNWLVQGMVTKPHPSHYPRTDFGTTSGTATHQSDYRESQCLEFKWKNDFSRKTDKNLPSKHRLIRWWKWNFAVDKDRPDWNSSKLFVKYRDKKCLKIWSESQGFWFHSSESCEFSTASARIQSLVTIIDSEISTRVYLKTQCSRTSFLCDW